MMVPLAVNDARRPAAVVPSTRTVTVLPRASVIWDAMVRCHTSS